MSAQQIIRIGTRGSPLALAQAREVRRRLTAAHGDLASDHIELMVIRTTGDAITDRPLGEVGGKGLFTREIEEALLADEIDLAVHSMKDLPTALPTGLEISCVLEREDPRDGFLSPKAASLSELPEGATVGTASLRRTAQILARHPGLKVVSFRGNVETRLRKLKDGVVDATLLALAGLRRLGLEESMTSAIEVEDMLPAVAQGVIGIECRVGDETTATLLAPLNHGATEVGLKAERAFLAALDGSCQTPIAALAEVENGQVYLRGQILRPDGSQTLEGERHGPAADAAALGRELGGELRTRAGPGFFDAGA